MMMTIPPGPGTGTNIQLDPDHRNVMSRYVSGKKMCQTLPDRYHMSRDRTSAPTRALFVAHARQTDHEPSIELQSALHSLFVPFDANVRMGFAARGGGAVLLFSQVDQAVHTLIPMFSNILISSVQLSNLVTSIQIAAKESLNSTPSPAVAGLSDGTRMIIHHIHEKDANKVLNNSKPADEKSPPCDPTLSDIGVSGLTLILDFINPEHEHSLIQTLLAFPTLNIAHTDDSIFEQKKRALSSNSTSTLASNEPSKPSNPACNSDISDPTSLKPGQLHWTRDFSRRVLHAGFAFDYSVCIFGYSDIFAMTCFCCHSLISFFILLKL
jgi:hypothetical protein